jgi:hypothetical protein
VITGTTFDMKVTETGTTLMVVEGSVRFESEGGAAQVSASQQSTIAGTLTPPSTPTACEAVAMTAWAGADRNTSQIAQEIGREDLSLDDLVLFPSPGTQTDLKSTNYAPWVERNRKWFQQQFPDIFRLREALTQEDVAVDYPDLLLASTAVWQFAYPPARPSRLSGIEEAALRKAARRYGKDLQWLRSKGLLPVARAVTDEQRQMREPIRLPAGSLVFPGGLARQQPVQCRRRSRGAESGRSDPGCDHRGSHPGSEGRPRHAPLDVHGGARSRNDLREMAEPEWRCSKLSPRRVPAARE